LRTYQPHIYHISANFFLNKNDNSKLGRKDVTPLVKEDEIVCDIKDAAYLFTTATCPNCKIACATLDKEGFKYEKLLADENADLATKFGVKQAPTLVVVKDGEVEKFSGVSDIKKMLRV